MTLFLLHFFMMTMISKKAYRQYSDTLKAKFGCKVYKVTLDAGFTCPNRDGSKGVGGCTFCDETGSSSRAQNKKDSITVQLEKNIVRMRERFKAEKFIAYFQSYTNTYSRPERLKRLYDEALSAHPDIVGMSISTRPDCVNAEILDLIHTYQTPSNSICVEYGMQTIHNKTLEVLNRCETHQDFLSAFQMTRERGLDMCVHVILGLPGETREDMIETARVLSHLKPEGVKIHLLCAMKHTPLEQAYLRGEWRPLEKQEYVELVCDFIEHLDPDIAIHRITGNGHQDGLVAPRWLTHKFEVLTMVDQTFLKRGSSQGQGHSPLIP
jgi:uncharacterized protein